ncbi:hypothetical protein [Nocardia fluminea]|uniref:Uncharacterized protein n=1 Tax=Nocardia fluminea TaxID=134984 RepID=A0A2N3V545_9NOCA|nr:hypothetical protein [Nocardia fluminea]PKV76748.1 hypothetical protein ATK86_7150 [Nocardia fluminea]
MSTTVSSASAPEPPPHGDPDRRAWPKLRTATRTAVTTLAIPFLSGAAYQIGSAVVNWLTT